MTNPELTIPFWGLIDSNIDWCEANYAFSPYVAELANTLSSLPISLCGLWGLIMSRRYALDERRHNAAFIILILVGLGSMAFHMTLRRFAQSLDELPMLIATIVLLYNVMDVRHGWTVVKRQDGTTVIRNPFHHRLRLKLLLFALTVTLIYIYFVFPELYLIFFFVYSTILLAFSLMMLYHISGYAQPMTIPQHALTAAERKSTTLPTLELSPLPSRLFLYGFIGYMGGFAIWCIENALCHVLPSWAYLHAVWHIAAGLGTYCVIQTQIAWRGEIHRAKVRYGRRKDEGWLNSVALLPYVIITLEQ